ncbi:GNAT family N-acetyltransferase [Paenibacillus illinoisensis]|uniref:GNAT family N-acetyltransferase n=1 Tax=Paenibacillus illinoisensis TaxID=59845 RepID=UPI001C8DA604|nr:GNAT family N-acetyltransferase [Paenibacillus illinoisensis]MBY0216347.1 GNAT family N-acetyltransferase [Paenibacillus illinoisensis]
MNNPTINIQEYTAEYQSQVIRLILQIQQQEYQISITGEDQPDLLEIETFYQKGIGNFWIALANDEVVGTIALLDIGEEQAALRKMFVAKNYRGKELQVSRRLLHQAFQWAKEMAVHDIYLGTTQQFVAAHRFYEKNGFVSVTREALPDAFPVMKVDSKFYHLTTPFA